MTRSCWRIESTLGASAALDCALVKLRRDGRVESSIFHEPLKHEVAKERLGLELGVNVVAYCTALDPSPEDAHSVLVAGDGVLQVRCSVLGISAGLVDLCGKRTCEAVLVESLGHVIDVVVQVGHEVAAEVWSGAVGVGWVECIEKEDGWVGPVSVDRGSRHAAALGDGFDSRALKSDFGDQT